MDAHRLAIAVLDRFAQPPSHRRDNTGKVASSSPNTGTGMMDNVVDHENAALVQQLSHSTPGTGGISADMAGSQESALPMSSNNSQSTTDGHDAGSPLTPASDGFSSQNTSQESKLSQLSQLSQLAAAQAPMSEATAGRQNLRIASTAGHKRTADGQVKPPSPDAITQAHLRGHSRNTSAVSNVSSVASSRIGELSSELRTRLSYAMVKVNNGWQSNSIDEVESLASQAGSPASSTSTLHGRRNLPTSPWEAIATVQAHNAAPAVPITQAPPGDFDLYSRAEPQSGTYESFWRSHSTAIPPNRSSLISPPILKASLAPPADIRPQPTSRRSHTPKFSEPPTIPGQGSHSSVPHTPNRSDLGMESKSLQTPTQKTIQEQDAIETLMFMSSPGNSGNMGHQFPPRTSQASPHASPLRTEFNAQDSTRGTPGRRVEFEKSVTSTAYPQSGKIGISSGKRKQDAIDKLLDEMGDSSSDECELVLNYSSPRRVAAGRV